MTEEVSRAFVKSQDINPNNFLSDGETPEQAKTRIMSVTTLVIQKGLSMCDGELHFGDSIEGMTDAKTVLGLLKDEDANYMRHSNDSLMNAMGGFLTTFQMAFMPPEKAHEEFNPAKKLPQIRLLLKKMYDCGFDGEVKPVVRNSQIGPRSSGVSAQASMAGKGLRHRTFS